VTSSVSLLFVGFDNVCRSAAALAVARAEAARRGLTGVVMDSAGTSWRCVGEPAWSTVRQAALERGIVVDHRARRVKAGDLSAYDLLIVMDSENLNDLERLRAGMDLRTTFHAISEPFQIQLLRRWDPYAMPGDEDLSVPEFGSAAQVSLMLDVLLRSIPALVDHLERMAATSI
jgi:protein-tyrosine-phosphatase